MENVTDGDGFAKANSTGSTAQGRHARFREIAQALQEAIQAGVYKAGDRLPTELELAQQHGVSRVTAAAALSELARAGLVTRAPRRGTIVRPGAQYHSATTRKIIALILPNLEQTHALGLLRGIELGARAAGFGLLLSVSQESHEEEGRAIREAVTSGATGVVIFIQDGESYNADVLRLVLGNFPVVLIDRYLRGVRCALVSSDNVGGSRMLVQELLDAGHRQICVITRPPDNTSAIEDRIRGYVLALTGAGVPVDYSLHYVVHAPFPGASAWEPAPEMVSQFVGFLQEHSGVTAIYATNAQLALLAYRATQHLQLCIPKDISLACIDPLEGIPLSLPAITCAIQPGDAIGETAVTLLQEAMVGRPPRTVQLPMELRRAGSVGPPATARRSVAPRVSS